jgi:hypothetical protein
VTVRNRPSDSVIFNEFVGLTNVVSEERLNKKQLLKGDNIDIDDAGQIRRRRGYRKLADGQFHSLYSNGTKTLVVKDGVLSRVYPDGTTSPIKTGIGAERLAYVTVASDIYFCSSTASGIVAEDDTVGDWGATTSAGQWISPVVNPSDELPEVRGRLFGKPPTATSLAHFNGRIYLADDNLLWATELFLYKLVDKTRNFIQFESKITGLAHVQDGLYVGTETGVYFLTGAFTEMRRIKITDAGMIPGSVVYTQTDAISDKPQAVAEAGFFLTTDGLCVGLPGGVCNNLTQAKYLFPETGHMASMFRFQDGVAQYVGVLDNAGTPTSRARVGDYVDAEIIRFSGA